MTSVLTGSSERVLSMRFGFPRNCTLLISAAAALRPCRDLWHTFATAIVPLTIIAVIVCEANRVLFQHRPRFRFRSAGRIAAFLGES